MTRLDTTEPEHHTPGPYVIGQPGGPSGPFWSIVNQQGMVVAMQIMSEADAKAIVAGLNLLNAQKERTPNGGHATFDAGLKP